MLNVLYNYNLLFNPFSPTIKPLLQTVLVDLEKHFRSTGYQEVVLLVHKNAGWAIEFYKQNCFLKQCRKILKPFEVMPGMGWSMLYHRLCYCAKNCKISLP